MVILPVSSILFWQRQAAHKSFQLVTRVYEFVQHLWQGDKCCPVAGPEALCHTLWYFSKAGAAKKCQILQAALQVLSWQIDGRPRKSHTSAGDLRELWCFEKLSSFRFFRFSGRCWSRGCETTFWCMAGVQESFTKKQNKHTDVNLCSNNVWMCFARTKNRNSAAKIAVKGYRSWCPPSCWWWACGTSRRQAWSKETGSLRVGLGLLLLLLLEGKWHF